MVSLGTIVASVSDMNAAHSSLGSDTQPLLLTGSGSVLTSDDRGGGEARCLHRALKDLRQSEYELLHGHRNIS